MKERGMSSEAKILLAAAEEARCRLRIGAIGYDEALEHRRGIGNKTINNRLAVLRRCLNCAREWDCLEAEPPRIKALKCPSPKTDYLTIEECETLLAHASGTVRELVLLALRTGMRQGELRGLQWEAIDWVSGVVIVRHSLSDCVKQLTSTKSNKARYVPLTDDAHALLVARKQSSGYVFKNAEGRPFTGNLLLQHLHRAQTRAGLRSFGWHTLRHTFASQLAVNGVPLRVVQDLLGHSTIIMTQRYSHVAPGNLRAAVNTLCLNYGSSAVVGDRWAMENAAH